MKRLTREKQTQIVAALIEGNSIRATSRMFGVSRDTVLKLQVEAGLTNHIWSITEMLNAIGLPNGTFENPN